MSNADYTCSCGLSCGGNKARGARPVGAGALARGGRPLDSEAVSRKP